MEFMNMLENKTDKRTVNYMVNHFNPNDKIAFDEKLMERDPEYRHLERKHTMDMIKWRYYNLYLDMFCGRQANPQDKHDIEASKKFDIHYIGIMEDVIKYRYHSDLELQIFREHRGLIDGKIRSYEEIHKKTKSLFPAKSYLALDIAASSDIKQSAMWLYSEYVGYCQPKSEDFNQTLEQCNDTLEREELYDRLREQQENQEEKTGGRRM